MSNPKEVHAGPYTLEKTGNVEWKLKEAASPHRAFLSDSLVDLLAEDGKEDGGTLRQIRNVTALPNTESVITTPDTHYGFGSPIGTVYVSPATVSLSVVGADISCGMSLVLTGLRKSDLGSREARLALMQEISTEVPMGEGIIRDNSDVVSDFKTLVERGVEGLRPNIKDNLKLSRSSFEFEQDFSKVSHLFDSIPNRALVMGEGSLGSLGGGNHFLELQYLEVLDPAIASAWGIHPDQVVVMIHSGSRRFGSEIANYYENESGLQFEARRRAEQQLSTRLHAERIARCRIERRNVTEVEFDASIDMEAGEIILSYTAPPEYVEKYRQTGEAEALLGSLTDTQILKDGSMRQLIVERISGLDLSTAEMFDPSHMEAELPFVLRPLEGYNGPEVPASARELAEGYWTAVQAAQNFAVLSRTVMQHRAVNVLNKHFGASKVDARLLYDISHNLVQVEPLGRRPMYVHRKGATRAFPAGHPLLKGTPWLDTGHPVVVPGNMGSFSYIMRASPTSARSAYSVNHGAGRALSRGAARRELDAGVEQAKLDAIDTVVVGGSLEEMPAAYKDIDEVVRVCVEGGLSSVVARCHPLGTAKGTDKADD